LTDLDVSSKAMEVAFINSKGFGGNNATAVVLSAEKANAMLANRHSDGFAEYLKKREITRSEAAQYAARADAAELNVIYRFGEPLIDEAAVQISETGMSIPGFDCEVQFNLENSWQDMQKTD
jgi:acetoacetyl-[acyl-carrier protein] synthase